MLYYRLCSCCLESAHLNSSTRVYVGVRLNCKGDRPGVTEEGSEAVLSCVIRSKFTSLGLSFLDDKTETTVTGPIMLGRGKVLTTIHAWHVVSTQ